MTKIILFFHCMLLYHTINYTEPSQEEALFVQQKFFSKSQYETTKERILNSNLSDLEQKLAYLIIFMKQTGESTDNCQMPHNGLSNASDFFAILCLHKHFDSHPERKNFINFSKILAERSKNFLQTMRCKKS